MSFTRSMKKIDIFGTTMNLTYKGKPTLQTSLGALFTIAFLTFIGVQFVQGILSVHSKDIISVYSQTDFINTDINENVL